MIRLALKIPNLFVLAALLIGIVIVWAFAPIETTNPASETRVRSDHSR